MKLGDVARTRHRRATPGVGVVWAWRGAGHGGWRAVDEAPSSERRAWEAVVGGCGGLSEACAECASSSCKMSEPSETKRLPAPSPVMPHPSEMPDGSATVSRSFSVRASRMSSSPSRHSSWMQRPACTVTPSPNQAPGRRSQWSSRPLSTSTRRTVDSP